MSEKGTSLLLTGVGCKFLRGPWRRWMGVLEFSYHRSSWLLVKFSAMSQLPIKVSAHFSGISKFLRSQISATSLKTRYLYFSADS